MYKTSEMKQICLEVIREQEPIYIEEMIAFCPFSKRLFYERMLHEDNDIKTALYKIKIGKKKKLRDKWEDGDNVTGQVVLYKLLATEEERAAIRGDTVIINNTSSTPAEITDEDLERRKQELRKKLNADT